jgi:hypothetical protein
MEVVVVATTATGLQAVGAVALGEAEVDMEVAMGEAEAEVDTEVDTEVATVMVHPVEEGMAVAVEAVDGIEGL